MLNVLMDNGYDTLAVGKIKDIFAGSGISEFVYTAGNSEGMERTLEYAGRDFNGLCFVNLVDYDMLYGHRRDIEGYAAALKAFDDWLPGFMEALGEEDLLMITADHGCDPGFTKSTDHTREYVPLIISGPALKGRTFNLGTRSSFADIAATVLKYFGLASNIAGQAVEL